jgi:hypothetical protein
MEGLKELVAASFARYGIECPEGDSQFVWGRAPSPVHVGTAALGCPAERSSAAACGHSDSRSATAQTASPTEPTALLEHNFRKSRQGDPVP